MASEDGLVTTGEGGWELTSESFVLEEKGTVGCSDDGWSQHHGAQWSWPCSMRGGGGIEVRSPLLLPDLRLFIQGRWRAGWRGFGWQRVYWGSLIKSDIRRQCEHP